jgi:hypothetical protein
MSKQDEIRKAIGAHGLWKAKLVQAIETKGGELKPEVVQLDDQCEFGKWLKRMSGAARADAHFAKAEALHAQFHKEAARVIVLAQAGKREEALKAIGHGSNYESLTTNLTLTLMDWSKAA